MPRPDTKHTHRKIIHIDMDAFFAAVEQRENPQYRGRPLIVGGSAKKRGVVATCSYEARVFGIHSAMPTATALRLCPDAIVVPPRIPYYRRVSQDVFAIFKTRTPRVEPVSIDEAYLDVTGNALPATDIAIAIKKEIQRTCGLTASAGVSYNKFLAKIASDVNKPDGLFVIPPDRGEAFVAELPIARFYGVGKVTATRMRELGINNGADLRRVPLSQLLKWFGKTGHYYYSAARGTDHRPVVTSRVRKSIGCETTFERDLVGTDAIIKELRDRARETARILAARELSGRTVTVKVKFSDFTLITRSHTLAKPLLNLSEILSLLPSLVQRANVNGRAVRLLGVSVSNLCASKHSQLDLLPEKRR